MSHQTDDDAIRPCLCADPWNCTETVPGYRCRKGEGFTTTAGTSDRTMASGAMVSASDDLASLRAQVQALQQHQDCHDLVCNGDRRFARGVVGHGCSCVSRAKREAEAAAAEIAQLRECIRMCEWAGIDGQATHCPACSKDRRHGHDSECYIAAALTSAPEGTT